MTEFPLQPFLVALAADGMLLTLRDYERVAIVLQTDGLWTLTRLRDTLLTLLARDLDQQQLFLRRFDEFFARGLADRAFANVDVTQALADLAQLARTPRAERAIRPPIDSTAVARPPSRTTPRQRLSWWVPLAIVLLLGMFGAAAVFGKAWFSPIPAPATLPTQPLTIEPPTEDTGNQQPPDVAVHYQRIYHNVPQISEPRVALAITNAWQMPAALAMFFLFAASLYGLYLWRSRRIPDDEAATWREDRTRHFALGMIGGRPTALLSDSLLDQLADSMGYFQSEERGGVLDVPASVMSTMHNGGLPTLAFHRRKQLRSLLILEDRRAAARVWNTTANELAAGMARRGVPVIHGLFDETPNEFKTSDGMVQRLEDLEDQRRAFLVLIFTDGANLRYRESTFVLEALAHWPMIAWMDLREPRFWDEITTLPPRYGIPIYPASPTGIAQAVRRFLTEVGATNDFIPTGTSAIAAPPVVGSPVAYIEQLLGDALPWAQDCAMFQPMSPGLANQLRTGFHPHLPVERIERLYALPDTRHNVAGIRFSAEVLSVLRRGWLARRSTGDQERILRLILEQVQKAQPAELESMAYLAWEAVCERVRLELNPAADLARLGQLAKTPLGNHIRADLEQYGFPDQVDKIPLRSKPQNKDALQRLARISDSFAIRRLDAYPIAWRQWLVLGTLVALFLGFTGLTFWRVQEALRAAPVMRIALARGSASHLMLQTANGDDWQEYLSAYMHGSSATSGAVQLDVAGAPDAMTLTQASSGPEQWLLTGSIPTGQQRVSLYGGGAWSTRIMTATQGQSLDLSVTLDNLPRECHDQFPKLKLTVERCPLSLLPSPQRASGTGSHQISLLTWSELVGTNAQGRVASVGLEIVGPQAQRPANNVGDRLLGSASIDVLYRILLDNYDETSTDAAIQQMFADLGPIVGQAQLVWWTVGDIPQSRIDTLQHSFDDMPMANLNLGDTARPAWQHDFQELFPIPGSAEPITEQDLIRAFDLHPQVPHPIVLLRQGFGTLVVSGVPDQSHATITLHDQQTNDDLTLAGGAEDLIFVRRAGRYRITAVADGYDQLALDITLTPGQEQTISLRLVAVGAAAKATATAVAQEQTATAVAVAAAPTSAAVVTSAPAPAAVTPTADQSPLITPTPQPRPTAAPLPAWVPELVQVPGGDFLMGSQDSDSLAESNEKPQHTLNLPTYWIGKTEVTNAQFRPFVEGDGYTNQAYWTPAGWEWRQSETITKPALWDDPQWNGDNFPVVGVSWYEAVAYCRWLSAQTGREFRLPSEAEWEKAARGTDGRIWPWGNDWKDGLANSSEAKLGVTTPVGQYPAGAGPYGALDMAGNVWEWCATKGGKPYPYQIEDEWQAGYLAANDLPVLRGGSWDNEQRFVRASYRDNFYPRTRYGDRGLRVASHSQRPNPES